MERKPYWEADCRSVFEQVPPECVLPFSEEPTEYKQDGHCTYNVTVWCVRSVVPPRLL
jgi:hypothetical protein